MAKRVALTKPAIRFLGCPNTKTARSIYEDARDVARTVCTTSAYERSRKDRKKVEMLLAHLKRILKLDRLRLRETKRRAPVSGVDERLWGVVVPATYAG